MGRTGRQRSAECRVQAGPPFTTTLEDESGTRMRRIQLSITLGALVVALVHVRFPSVTIDSITVSLIVIAILPWLAPLFRSVELPGGLKVEFQERLDRAADEADKAGLLAAPGRQARQYSFQLVAEQDPALALAGLRIELERQLKALAEAVGVGTRMQGAGRLIAELHKQGVLTGDEQEVLLELVGLLNEAVHGADVGHRASRWAMEIGPRLLESLQGKGETSG